MQELTFREVIANIKEGEVWESTVKTISLINGAINIERKNKIETYYIYIKESELFKLQRKEYTFEKAFKSYEAGKEIESVESGRIFVKDNGVDKVSFSVGIGVSFVSSDLGAGLSIKEIRNKWYIKNN